MFDNDMCSGSYIMSAAMDSTCAYWQRKFRGWQQWRSDDVADDGFCRLRVRRSMVQMGFIA